MKDHCWASLSACGCSRLSVLCKVCELTCTAPIRINREPKRVVGTGTIRGANRHRNRNRRAHVAWNGAQKSDGHEAPVFLTRKDGLLDRPVRSEGGHGLYDATALSALAFIKRGGKNEISR